MKTDTQLQQDVISSLQEAPAVNASQIGVRVRDGVVTLAGEVSSYLEKQSAELATQRVLGVKALASEMIVRLSAFGLRSDEDIASSALHALSWIMTTPSEDIQVMVENGWITLTGKVSWQFQRQAATDSVRCLNGVRGLSNQISIEPEPHANPIKSDIEAAICRRLAGRLGNIQVNIRGHEVILSGSAHSLAERDVAERAAWGSPGVHCVIDRIVIV